MAATKVLIVDDHLIVIEGIKSALQHYPEFEVVGEALNGHQAVKLSESLKPDIVIMDISMPGLNGVDATLQIKKSDPQIRIIMFTMNSNREFVVDLLRAGISAYVLKQDPISDLISALKAVSGGGTYFSTEAPTILSRHMKAQEEGRAEKSNFENISLREQKVFQALAEGKSTKEIAGQLHISLKTVESHKYNLMAKLNLESMADLIKLAIRENLIAV